MTDESAESIRVLIVDDSPRFIDILDFYFDKSDTYIFTDTTTDPEKALKKIKENYYDIILSESNFEGIDGIQLMKKVKEFNENIPFVIYTANHDSGLEEKAYEEGAAAFMEKDYGDNQHNGLIQLMKRETEAYRTQQELDISDQAVDFHPDLAVYFNEDGEIVKCNNSFLRETGMSRDSARGKNISEVLNNFNSLKINKIFQNTNGSSYELEENLMKGSSNYRYTAARVSDKNIIGMIGINQPN